jgi:hypothetical protein
MVAAVPSARRKWWWLLALWGWWGWQWLPLQQLPLFEPSVLLNRNSPGNVRLHRIEKEQQQHQEGQVCNDTSVWLLMHLLMPHSLEETVAALYVHSNGFPFICMQQERFMTTASLAGLWCCGGLIMRPTQPTL